MDANPGKPIRLCVMSDTHGSAFGVERALKLAGPVDVIFHLGDGGSEVRALCSRQDIPVYAVKGNCDFSGDLPLEQTVRLGGHCIFACHGHTVFVKHSTSLLVERAKQLDAQIALFGHTHERLERYENGVFLFNPGSLGRARPLKHNGFGLITLDGERIHSMYIEV